MTAVTGINTGVTLATSGFDRLDNGVPVQVHQGKQGAQGASGSKGSTGSTSGGNTTP
jgi:hypothetical protein